MSTSSHSVLQINLAMAMAGYGHGQYLTLHNCHSHHLLFPVLLLPTMWKFPYKNHVNYSSPVTLHKIQDFSSQSISVRHLTQTQNAPALWSIGKLM